MSAVLKTGQQESIYCSEQINIPVTFPNILKTYAKAAIRTQPYDLLTWTAAYFRSLANGQLPPVKERLEYPPYVHPSGITPRFLKILLKQYSHEEDCGNSGVTRERASRTMIVTLESILVRWRGMALKDESLYQILMTGRLLELPGAPTLCDLYRFLAIACGLMGNNLMETMIYICELLTEEPDGGSATIPLGIFMNLYEYLADLDRSRARSIIESTTTKLEPDEASSLVRSSRSTSHSDVSLSTFVALSSEIDGAVLCSDIDNSSEDTETEESLCHLEVPGDKDEEFASNDEASGSRDSTSQGTSGGVRRRTETETTRIPQPEESPSENTTYDDKKRSELKVPEGKVEKLGGVETVEVTRVQEERRRRRDVEIHSRTEKVKLMACETTTSTTTTTTTTTTTKKKTISKTVPRLDSPRSSPRRGTSSSSSSSGKSHVVVGKDVKHGETAETVTSVEKTKQPEFDQTDKILEARNVQLAQELDNPRVPDDVIKVSTNDIENIPRNGRVETEVRNVNVVGSRVKRIKKKKVAKRKGEAETRTRIRGNILGDSLEYEPTSNDDEDRVSRLKNRFSRHENDEKIPTKVENSRRGTLEGKKIELPLDLVDYVDEKSDDGNESDEYEEDVDMAKYEPIGLEKILEGICECVETRKDTSLAKDLDLVQDSSKLAPPIDIVDEFIERMRTVLCPTGAYFLPEVPGIGPPVSPETVTAVGLWLTECSRRQRGHVGPRNLRHFMCPNLDGKSRPDHFDTMENSCCIEDEIVVDLEH